MSDERYLIILELPPEAEEIKLLPAAKRPEALLDNSPDSTETEIDLPAENLFKNAIRKLPLPAAICGRKYRQSINIFTPQNNFNGKITIEGQPTVLGTQDIRAFYDASTQRINLEGCPRMVGEIKIRIKYKTRGLMQWSPALNEEDLTLKVLEQEALVRERQLQKAFEDAFAKLDVKPVAGTPYKVEFCLKDFCTEEFRQSLLLQEFEIKDSQELHAELTSEQTLEIAGKPIRDTEVVIICKYILRIYENDILRDVSRTYLCKMADVAPDPAIQQSKDFEAFFASLPLKKAMAGTALSTVEIPLPPPENFDRISEIEFKANDADLAAEYSKDDCSLSISGTPSRPGEASITCNYKLNAAAGEEKRNFDFKALMVTPDPRTLWKDLPTNPEAPYQSPNQAHQCINGEKTAIAASKRGRSHAHEGKFRDDNFQMEYIADTGWYIVAVSDGAGSAEYSREGSRIACRTFCDMLKERLSQIEVNDRLLAMSEDEQEKALKGAVLKATYQGMVNIDQEAQKGGQPRKKYAATFLGFVMKEIHGQWLIVAIGIGDGIIGLFDDKENLVLLTEPDGGEFVGQTRFITMNEVWQDNPAARVRSLRLPGFKFIMSMSDGVSDPKFETDNNLKKKEMWEELWRDLRQSVPFEERSDETAKALEGWLDFWAKGNHDDRTIAIVY